VPNQGIKLDLIDHIASKILPIAIILVIVGIIFQKNWAKAIASIIFGFTLAIASAYFEGLLAIKLFPRHL
jgi:uncharacterized membrane protein YfbV (UPF0208 family)